MPYIPSAYDQQVQARLTPVAPVAPTMPAMGSGAPEDFLTRARILSQDAIARARQGIDPRIAAILARREERLAGQEEEIAAQEARSPWDALARAGAAMASSQSPFFGQGIAQGVSAGLNELNQGRAEAVRRRMALGGARDDIEMQRIEQEGAGKREALAALERDLKLGGDMAAVAQKEAAARADLARAIEIEDPVLRGIKVRQEQAKLEKIQSERVATDALAAQRNRSERGGSGGGTPMTEFERRGEQIRQRLGEEAYNQYLATGKAGAGGGIASALTPTQRGQMTQNKLAVESALKQLETLESINPGMLTGVLAGRLPSGFSGSADKYEKALANLRAQFRKISRTTGEGSISDYETRLNNASLPERSDTPEGRAQAMADIRQQAEFLRDSYRDILGTRTQPPPSAIGMLKQNPALAPAFDRKYGSGSAASVLGAR